MVTVTIKSFINLPCKQWKKKQKMSVLVEQKIHANVKTANVNVLAANEENAHVKKNVHVAASVNNNI